MSTLAIWYRVVQSRDVTHHVSPHNFDGLAMSVLAISVAPLTVCIRGVYVSFFIVFVTLNRLLAYRKLRSNRLRYFI